MSRKWNANGSIVTYKQCYSRSVMGGDFECERERKWLISFCSLPTVSFFQSIFFPSASTHILSIRISAFIGVSRGVVVWDWSLEDLYSQAWFHHASTRWAEWRKSVLDFQPTRSVCPDYANDMPISFSSLTTAQQTGHLIWNPHSL